MNKQERLVSEIKPCPRPEKIVKIGRVLCSYQRGSDLWVNSKDPGYFYQHLISIQLVTSEDETILTCIFFKIKFSFGILPE